MNIFLLFYLIGVIVFNNSKNLLFVLGDGILCVELGLYVSWAESAYYQTFPIRLSYFYFLGL